MGTKLSPRKAPSQERSKATVEAIYDAAIQVLLKEGHHRTTTTRVAERAGVSVGSLYQYFPNKQAILVALMRRHLEGMFQCLEDVFDDPTYTELPELMAAVVHRLLDYKQETLHISRALTTPMTAPEGRVIVFEILGSMQRMVMTRLCAASNLSEQEAGLTAGVLISALEGPVTFHYEQNAAVLSDPAFRKELIMLAQGYLTARLA